MAANIQVVKIGKKDIPDVILLLRKIVGKLDEAQLMNVLITRMDSPYYMYMYGKLDGQIVGIIEVQYRKELQLFGMREYGFVPTIYVMPSHRRQGVGAKLLSLAAMWLKNVGARQVVVLSGPKDEGLNPFLQSQGFAPDQAKFVKPLV